MLATVKITVPGVDLSDLVNINDRVLREFAQAWVDRALPCVPVGILTDEPERWERVGITEYVVLDAHQADHDMELDDDEGYFLTDDSIRPVDSEGEPCTWAEAFYVDFEKAEEARESLQGQAEGLYGWPFADRWARIVTDDRVTVSDLVAAGYVVYDLLDCNGGRAATVCGIDGGGYNFFESHVLPLCLAYHARLGWPVTTESGPVVPRLLAS